MIVKKKAKEQTEFEKRNTAILVFVLIALVPLLLSFFLGMNMSETEDRNTTKLLIVLDSLREENAELNKSIKDLTELVSEVDSFQLAFSRAALKLEEKLIDIREDPDQELVARWDKEKKRMISRYKIDIEELAAKAKTIKNKQLAHIDKIGIKWIEQFFDAREEQLTTLKRKKELSLGADQLDAQQQQIKELEGKVLLKETMILNLEAALGQSQGSASSQLNDEKRDKKECEDELETLQETMATSQGKIEKEVDGIRDDILPKLKAKKVLNMGKIRKDLENKLNKIERYVGDLK